MMPSNHLILCHPLLLLHSIISSYKDTNPILRSSHPGPHLNPVSSQRPHLLMPLHWGLGLRCVSWRGAKVKVLVTQSCPTLWEPRDCSPPGSSVHGILQARILEWVATSSPGDLPNPGIKLPSLASPALAGMYHCATWKASYSATHQPKSSLRIVSGFTESPCLWSTFSPICLLYTKEAIPRTSATQISINTQGFSN